MATHHFFELRAQERSIFKQMLSTTASGNVLRLRGGEEFRPVQMSAVQELECANTLGEAPIWHGKEGKLYWLDINGKVCLKIIRVYHRRKGCALIIPDTPHSMNPAEIVVLRSRHEGHAELGSP
jgi:hypothetical protein